MVTIDGIDRAGGLPLMRVMMGGSPGNRDVRIRPMVHERTRPPRLCADATSEKRGRIGGHIG